MNRREFLATAAATGPVARLVAQTAPERGVPWYQRSRRRHFFDMHIPDTNSEFLTKVDPADIVRNLLLEKVTAVYYMFLSHTGLAYYKATVGQMHRGLEATGRDLIRELSDASHRAGLDVIAYYCLIYTNWYWEQHPEARVVDYAGRSERPVGLWRRHAGTVCPNNEAYREFVVAQLKEICQNYEFEGVWPDMTWWPTVCYCQTCQKRYDKELGGPIPRKVDWLDSVWVRFQRKRQEWLAEFARLVTSTIKEHKPGVTVVHQSGALADGDWINAASLAMAAETDWCSADTYSGREMQSYFDKTFYNLSRIKPWEHVQALEYPSMQEAVVSRSVEDLRCRAFQTFMNGGAMTFLEGLDPVGTLNRDNYARAGRVFGELEAYEPYGGGEFQQDVAIYRSYESPIPNHFAVSEVGEMPQFQAPPDEQPSEHLPACEAAARGLLENHLPFGVITRKDLANLGKYQIVLLPNLAMMHPEEAEAFRGYVLTGGSLYASKYTSLVTTDGRRQPDFLLADLFGASYQDETKDVVTYVEPVERHIGLFEPFRRQYPPTLRDSQAIIKAHDGAEVMATLTLPYTDPQGYEYANLLQNPPGIRTNHPSLILNRFGNGKVLYAAGPIEIWDYSTLRAIFGRLIKSLGTRPMHFTAQAPHAVELTVFHQPNARRLILHALNSQVELPNIPVDDVRVSVWLQGKQPRRVQLMPSGMDIKYGVRDDRVEFTLPRLETYRMCAISYA
jgi:hypothetical protein